MPKSNFSSGDEGRDSGSHMPKSNFSSGNGNGESSTHMLKSSFAPAGWVWMVLLNISLRLAIAAVRASIFAEV